MSKCHNFRNIECSTNQESINEFTCPDLCKWTVLETHHITYFENSWKIVEQTSMHIEKSINNYKIREPLTWKTFSEPTNQTLNIIENSLQEYVKFHFCEQFLNNNQKQINKVSSIKTSEALLKHFSPTQNKNHKFSNSYKHAKNFAELQSARWLSSGGDCQPGKSLMRAGRPAVRQVRLIWRTAVRQITAWWCGGGVFARNKSDDLFANGS